MSTTPEAALRTQTVGRGDGEGVGAFEAEYDGDAETDAVGLGEAAVEADCEGEAAVEADPPTAQFLNRLLVEQARPVETWYLERLPSATRKNMEQTVLKALPAAAKSSIKNWEMLGMLLVTTGGGFGLVAFGPICERIGRRRTFLFFHLGGLVSALVLFQLFATASAGFYWVALPIFGFLTLGMHAGYAIYFPELFPTRLRGTGGGFCFNGGRILAAPILIIRGWMRDDLGLGLSLETVVSILSLLFLLGVVFSLLGPETKGRELPE